MKAPMASRPSVDSTVRDGLIADLAAPVSSTGSPAAKRALDVMIGFVLLILSAPVLLMVALWVLVTSPGPVLFKQERVGRYGRRFLCYKFRTMKLGASMAGDPDQSKSQIGLNTSMAKLDTKGDPRLIPGAWLVRASGLDELPQILNVLRGEMSLVGPRPCQVYEWERVLRWHSARGEVLPGLTGLWQVSGKNMSTYGQMIRLDIKYARHHNVRLDLAIMLRTAPALIEQVIDTCKARRSPRMPKAVAT